MKMERITPFPSPISASSLTYTEEAFGTELRQYCTKMAAPYLQSHKLEMQADRLHLTREGIFVSDGIISDLMFIE